MATGLVSGDTALRTGTYRAIPEAAMDKGSVVLPARRVVSRRCVAVAASMAG
jgi:hypothetical protein